MTVSDDTEAPLWAIGCGRPKPRQAPAKCALCADPPASVFGLCARCLAAAAVEAARLRPRPAAASEDGRSSSNPFSALCRRCGRPGHDARSCDA
jgi:hypothetical protein